MSTDSDKVKKERLQLELLQSIFHTSKKSVQEYVREIERHCRFKSAYRHLNNGTVLDDRGKLIDLYDATVQQDAHLAGVLETLYSQILGERYMLAKMNEKGRYVKDLEQTKLIQGTQFIKIIRAIVESKLYGYSGLELTDKLDDMTGKLASVNIIERRNILPSQRRIVMRQGIWEPGWSFDDPKYKERYVLIDSGDIGLFSATTPLILAKKFTFANYVNFSHTYGLPIIHGKAESENNADRKRMAAEIASAGQNRVIVTGLNDEVDVKTFTMSNSEHIFTSLISMVDHDVSNLILGSTSMAGETQAYVGAAQAHQDIYRDRIEVYRDYIELVMNELIIPRFVAMGYLKPGNEFKYVKRIEMSDENRIKLYQVLGQQWEMDPDVIESEFGVKVKQQLTVHNDIGGAGGSVGVSDPDHRVGRRMSDEEYFRRYGHYRDSVNFLTERGK